MVVAEREGFEPSIRYNRIPDFESGAFDHSAISPRVEPQILASADLKGWHNPQTFRPFPRSKPLAL